MTLKDHMLQQYSQNGRYIALYPVYEASSLCSCSLFDFFLTKQYSEGGLTMSKIISYHAEIKNAWINVAAVHGVSNQSQLDKHRE